MATPPPLYFQPRTNPLFYVVGNPNRDVLPPTGHQPVADGKHTGFIFKKSPNHPSTQRPLAGMSGPV